MLWRTIALSDDRSIALADDAALWRRSAGDRSHPGAPPDRLLLAMDHPLPPSPDQLARVSQAGGGAELLRLAWPWRQSHENWVGRRWGVGFKAHMAGALLSAQSGGWGRAAVCRVASLYKQPTEWSAVASLYKQPTEWSAPAPFPPRHAQRVATACN